MQNVFIELQTVINSMIYMHDIMTKKTRKYDCAHLGWALWSKESNEEEQEHASKRRQTFVVLWNVDCHKQNDANNDGQVE